MESENSIKELTRKEFVNPNTGEVHIQYYWKRNKAPKVEIKGKLPNKMSGLTLIKKDLDNALKWMKLARKLSDSVDDSYDKSDSSVFLAKDRERFDNVKALFVASLTFYGKCFTEANGRGASVSRNWLNEEYKELHDFYMNYRHNFAAHSGDSKVELAKSFVLLHPKKKELIPITPTFRLQPDAAFSFNGIKFEDLLVYISNLVAEKYIKLANKIVTELILVKDIDFWIDSAKKGKAVELGFPKK